MEEQSLSVKIGNIRNQFFSYSANVSALTRIDSFHSVSQAADAAQIMLVTGPPGSGKTELLARYHDQYSLKAATAGHIEPIIRLSVPSDCTSKALASDMLAALGDPHADRGTKPNMTRRIVHYLANKQTTLLMLDEVQHFVESQNHKVIFEAADWFKSVVSSMKGGLVLSGTPKLLRLFQENQQLERRVTGVVRLHGFPFSSQRDREEFRTLLALFANELPFQNAHMICGERMAKMLHFVSKGLIGRVARFLQVAAETAVREGSATLEVAHFAQAYTELSLEPNADEGRSNPFVL